MQVFNICIKILKRNASSLTIFMVIFIGLSLFMSFEYKADYGNTFNQQKPQVVFINRDKDSVFLEGLKEHLSEQCEFVNIEDDKKKLQDALFFREAVMVFTVPEGFTEQLFGQEKPAILKQSVPDSAEAIYAEMAADNYLKAANVYITMQQDITEAELVKVLKEDFGNSARIDLMKQNNEEKDYSFLTVYYNLAMYSILSILISGLTTIMLIFRDKEIQRRNRVAPISNLKIDFQLFLGYLLFALIVAGIMIILSFVMDGSAVLNVNMLLYIFNVLVFTVTAFSISFLCGMFIKSHNSSTALSNILSLGFCFISGAFVPRELLGKEVLKVASFTPSYWYVQANEFIGNLRDYRFENIKPILLCILIEAGFALALFAICMVVSKKRQAEAV